MDWIRLDKIKQKDRVPRNYLLMVLTFYLEAAGNGSFMRKSAVSGSLVRWAFLPTSALR